MRKFVIGLTLIVVAQSAAAQVAESIEVRITNVDVVVTDRAGKPVSGLTKEDFRLFEDGKEQAVTNFYEVRSEKGGPSPAAAEQRLSSPAERERVEEAPVELRRRRVILFVDEYSLHPFRRNEVFKAVEQRFHDVIREGDEAMIVTWSRGLRVEQTFTSDQAVLSAKLHELATRGGGALTLDAERQLVKDKVKFAMTGQRASSGNQITDARALVEIVRGYADEVSLTERQLIASMNTMLSTLAGLDGKKVMLYVGAHLPEKPGAEIFVWLQQYLSGLTEPDVTKIALNAGPTLSASAMNAIAEASHRSVTVDIEKMAKNANSAGVTMYLIDTADPEHMNTVGDSDIVTPEEQMTQFVGTAQAFQTIARITGGMAVTGSRNFDLAVNTITTDLGSYYSLGYRSTDDKGGTHKVVVKATNPAYHVRARTSFVAKSAEQQMEERVVANIFRPNDKNDFAIALKTGNPVSAGLNIYSVPIEITIPPALTLLPDGSDVAGGFTVYIAVGDERGAMSGVSKRAQPVRIPATAKAQQKQPMVFTADVKVRPGEHFMSVAVVDQLTNSAAFARAKVVAR